MDDLKLFLEDFVDYLNGQEASNVKLRRQIETLVGDVKPKAASFPESPTFDLKYEAERGAKLGAYEVGYRSLNLVEKWQHCFNVLKANNAVIRSPFHPEGYTCRYWIYPEKYQDRIFRKKLTDNEARP